MDDYYITPTSLFVIIQVINDIISTYSWISIFDFSFVVIRAS